MREQQSEKMRLSCPPASFHIHFDFKYSDSCAGQQVMGDVGLPSTVNWSFVLKSILNGLELLWF